MNYKTACCLILCLLRKQSKLWCNWGEAEECVGDTCLGRPCVPSHCPGVCWCFVLVLQLCALKAFHIIFIPFLTPAQCCPLIPAPCVHAHVQSQQEAQVILHTGMALQGTGWRMSQKKRITETSFKTSSLFLLKNIWELAQLVGY